MDGVRGKCGGTKVLSYCSGWELSSTARTAGSWSECAVNLTWHWPECAILMIVIVWLWLAQWTAGFSWGFHTQGYRGAESSRGLAEGELVLAHL